MSQALQPNETLVCKESACFMLESIEEDYRKWKLFSDEATFHVSGHVNCLHVQIWGTKKTTCDMSRCSQQSKAKYVVHSRVTDTYFFYEKAIT
jgi:hypothetical protein